MFGISRHKYLALEICRPANAPRFTATAFGARLSAGLELAVVVDVVDCPKGFFLCPAPSVVMHIKSKSCNKPPQKKGLLAPPLLSSEPEPEVTSATDSGRDVATVLAAPGRGGARQKFARPCRHLTGVQISARQPPRSRGSTLRAINDVL